MEELKTQRTKLLLKVLVLGPLVALFVITMGIAAGGIVLFAISLLQNGYEIAMGQGLTGIGITDTIDSFVIYTTMLLFISLVIFGNEIDKYIELKRELKNKEDILKIKLESEKGIELTKALVKTMGFTFDKAASGTLEESMIWVKYTNPKTHNSKFESLYHDYTIEDVVKKIMNLTEEAYGVEKVTPESPKIKDLIK